MEGINFKGKKPLELQLSKSAEGAALIRFGSIEDFEKILNERTWYVHTDNGEKRIVCCELRTTIRCAEMQADNSHPEPYLFAKTVGGRNKSDKYGGPLGDELERPIKVLRAKPKSLKEKQKRICPYCFASDIEWSSKYCYKCGAKMPPRYCDSCGSIVDSEEKCAACGRIFNNGSLEMLMSKEKKAFRKKVFVEKKWKRDEIDGFEFMQNYEKELERLKKKDFEAFERVMDALVTMYTHADKAGALEMRKEGKRFIFMGKMEFGDGQWVEGILSEYGVARRLGEYKI